MGSPADAVPATTPKSRAFGQPNACARHQPARPPTRGEALPAPRRRCQATLPVALSPLGRLPDLSALLPGLRRRRRRRPRGHPLASRPPRLARAWTRSGLSPIYPSPMADFGYDVSDYTGVDPVFGDLAEFDALTEEAHARGLSVLMDIVPCHTSIEHPWFREHPDWYIWADAPNNWLSAFGGSAWAPTRRALLPALVLPRAARPRLAQPRGDRGDAGRVALLARARRGRVPDRRDRPAAEGPRAARRAARHRGRSACR